MATIFRLGFIVAGLLSFGGTAVSADNVMWMTYGEAGESYNLWLTEDLCEAQEAKNCVLVTECDGFLGYGTDKAAMAFWLAERRGHSIFVQKSWAPVLSEGFACFYD